MDLDIVLIVVLLPFLGTLLGSSAVLFVKGAIPELVQKTLLGFASGVMVAASVWSLLIPGMEMSGAEGLDRMAPVVVGFMAGMAALLLIDRITPHIHAGEMGAEGPRSSLSRTAKLTLAVAIHNLPEGMAVGVVLAGAVQEDAAISIAGAVAMALGIAIQNIPEGAIVSMPLRIDGNGRVRAFAIGGLSGVIEPLGSVLVLLLAEWLTPAMPYLLAFAAGAMLYVVVEELIPSTAEGRHSNVGTIGFAIGFALMMALDTAL